MGTTLSVSYETIAHFLRQRKATTAMPCSGAPLMYIRKKRWRNTCMYAADIPSAIPMWASMREQKHPGAAWQTGTCAGNARRHTAV